MARRKTQAMPPLNRLRRTGQAEQETGLSRRTLYRMAGEGRLTIYKIGGATYWSLDELGALVTRRGAA